MSRYPLADKTGVTKRAIQKATANGLSEEDIFRFIHGDVNQIHQKLPEASGCQRWESTGKRFVHLEEAQFIAKHFLRNAIKPNSTKALVLSGTDPALACLPWAMSGLATEFVAYEFNSDTYNSTKRKIPEETRKAKAHLPEDRKFKLQLVEGDVLEDHHYPYGIIDLDFCNNKIRTPESRENILRLLDRVSPYAGPFVLRTTLHLGRVNNSRKDVEQHIDDFERELKDPAPGYQPYKIRAHDRSPYQSTLPMVSLVWILERQNHTKELRGETE